MRDTTQLTERAKRDIAYWMEQQRSQNNAARFSLNRVAICVEKMTAPGTHDYEYRQQVMGGYALEAAIAQHRAAFAFRMIRYIRDYEDE